jgi:protein phosphatase
VKLIYDVFGVSDVGTVRKNNEDQFMIADLCGALCVKQTTLPRKAKACAFGTSVWRVLAVADGLGGHRDGERASSLALRTLSEHLLNSMSWFSSPKDVDDHALLRGLREGMVRCDEMLCSRSRQPPRRKAMGTTLTLSLVAWPRLYIVHVGDSRCYLHRRASGLKQLTRDHTEVQALVERGKMTSEEAQRSRWGHLLSQVIGGGQRGVKADVYKVRLQPNDTLLLCTDGLTGDVSDRAIANVLATQSSARQSCGKLLRLARQAGGNDNTTVVIARFPELVQGP